MKVIRLNKQQITFLYKNYMVHDFPKDELKPLFMITKGMDQGNYECLGYVDNHVILAYAVLVKRNNTYLFDYLGSTVKNKGYGSKFLSKLNAHLKEADCVLVEVENFEYETDIKEKEIQIRRFNFYLRNGYVDTHVNTYTFGVEYKILEMKKEKLHTKEEIKTLYESHYKEFVPRLMYKANIKVHD